METRGYEALIILKAAGTDQEIAKRAAQLEEPIKKLGGKIEHSQNMGRRRLAFPIAHQQEGYYLLLLFSALPEHVKELERLYRLNDSIVRFMILNQQDAPVRPLLKETGSVAATSVSQIPGE